jgi:exodeoxyribonuclease-3
MRIVTYNVNSLKARLPRVVALLDEHAPDIMCVQETKSTPEAFPHDALRNAGYEAVDHSGGRWEGVAILAKTGLEVDDVVRGLPGEPTATQARWVEATVGGVRVASVYVPNGRALGTETFAEKLAFLDAMAARAATMADGPALIAGDFNVCLADIDVWDPAAVHGGTHISADERQRLAAVLDRGFVDAFRTVDPDAAGFTWWDYRAGHFHKGFGLRIDLVLLSNPLAPRLGAAQVDRAYRKPTKVPAAKPSDHAPVLVDLVG